MTSTSTHDAGTTAAYRKKFAALLGDRDPLDVFTTTPGTLEMLLAPHSAELLRKRPFADRWTWTVNEIVGHLIDAEIVYGFRARLILCEDRPAITPMDQEKWVAGQRYNDREPAENLAAFRAIRQQSIDFWRRVPPTAMQRVGIHAERGEESLATMVRMLAGHDLSHIDQITRYLDALTGKA